MRKHLLELWDHYDHVLYEEGLWLFEVLIKCREVLLRSPNNNVAPQIYIQTNSGATYHKESG